MFLFAKKRRFQFGLRSLFLLTLFVAIAAGWYEWKSRNARIQKQLIEEIASKGGFVWYDLDGSWKDIHFSRPAPFEPCGQIRCLAAPKSDKVTFEDRDLQLVAKLSRVRSVDFAATKVSISAIEEFRHSHPTCEVKP